MPPRGGPAWGRSHPSSRSWNHIQLDHVQLDMRPDDPNLDDFVRWELEMHRDRLERSHRRRGQLPSDPGAGGMEDTAED